MKLVDANILVYAFVQAYPQHERARDWLNDALNGTTLVGLPWASVLAFVRLVSNPRIHSEPASVARAWQQVEEWLSADVVWMPHPGERHAAVLGELIPLCSGRPNLVPDAHLAALAIEHGLSLCSTDRDFASFPGLRWENPLAIDGPA